MRKRLSKPTIIAIIAGLLSSILAAGVTGVIGNRADNLFLSLWTLITSSIKANTWLWIIFITVFLALMVIFYFRQQIKVLNQAFTTTNNIVTLDDLLLRFFASYEFTSDNQKQIQQLLTEILEATSAEFGKQIIRGSILLPEGEYLKIWAHFRMPRESVERTKFYMGKEKSKLIERGVAGEVFLEQRLRIVHMAQQNGFWRSDDNHFIDSVEKDPPYRSFACVPIIGIDINSTEKKERAVTCLGVLCFDSKSTTTFDKPGAHVVLRVFARRIAATLSIYQQLKVLTSKKANL